MSFYLITYGITNIEKAYLGETEIGVVDNARPLINQWPEYAQMDNDEILEILHEDDAEFDIVKVNADWPGDDANLEILNHLYDNNSVPPHMYI